MKPDQNHKSHHGTSLNKELFKRSRIITEGEKREYAKKRVAYERQLRSGTSDEMTDEEFNKRVKYIMCRKLIVELTQVSNHIIFFRLKYRFNDGLINRLNDRLKVDY